MCVVIIEVMFSELPFYIVLTDEQNRPGVVRRYLQTPMMMDEVRVTVTNSLDVPHVAFLGFVGEMTPQFTCHADRCMPLQSLPSLP